MIQAQALHPWRCGAFVKWDKNVRGGTQGNPKCNLGGEAMPKIILCGHTGSKNRGCEALVRSTNLILKQAGWNDVVTMTYDRAYDQRLGVDRVAELVPYPTRTFVQKATSALARRLLHNVLLGNTSHFAPVLQRADGQGILLNIGGDTYCYGTPYMSYALNQLAERQKIPTVFWGCSVEARCRTDLDMQRDLNRYGLIIARESLTYDLLRQCVKEPDAVLLACDPAFHLPVQPVDLPQGFLPHNTLGLNLSPLVFTDGTNAEDPMYQNVRALIDFLLETTDLAICLIPHVYSVSDRSGDLQVLDQVKAFYPNNPRVLLEDRELSCTELKFIVGQCRFFVGARTHATIAAYSSGVPAIALSYSIKSRGIAKDLFGREEGYALPWEQLQQPTMLLDAFRKILQQQEEALRTLYAQTLPAYKQSILDATEQMKRRLIQ